MVGGVGMATCCICKGLGTPKSSALALDSSPSENLADNWPLYGVPPLSDSRDQGLLRPQSTQISNPFPLELEVGWGFCWVPYL